MRIRFVAVLGALAAALAAASPARAASLEEIGTFNEPVYVTSLPDPNRLLVAEKPGMIQLVHGGAASTFLDIRSLVTSVGSEQGLLSVVASPDYGNTGHVYVA
jgi:glucose/arabinose dehydrogenase